MANDLDPGIKQTWAKRYQVTHHKLPVYPAFSNFEAAADLQKGDTFNKDYRNTLVANDVGSEGSYQRQDINDTEEQLIINQEKEATFYIRDLDELQNHLPTRDSHAFDAAAAIFNAIDGHVLGNYDNFTPNLSDGDLGGTSGNGITPTTANIAKLFTLSRKKVQRQNIMLDPNARFTGFRKEDKSQRMPVALLSPDVFAIIEEKLEAKDSPLGDRVALNGHQGRYMGFEIFVSNAMGWSGSLELATQPTDGDTVVLNGVTFTFKTTLGSTAGNVLIGADADAARLNLTGLINAPGTTDTEGVALSKANQDLLKGITATDDASGNTMAIKAVGFGFVIVSETFTDATDVWAQATQIQHLLFGQNQGISVVVQKTPKVRAEHRTGYIGDDVITWAAYGSKVFNEDKNRMVDVKIRTDSYV